LGSMTHYVYSPDVDSKIKVEVESEFIFEFATESELLNQGGARAFQVMLYYYFWTYLNYTHLVFFYHQIQSYYLRAQFRMHSRFSQS
jgi:hypothetical protein